MASSTSIDVREVIFLNPDTESGHKELLAGVGEETDGALTRLQNGQVPARRELWRMLKGKLCGIGEVSRKLERPITVEKVFVAGAQCWHMRSNAPKNAIQHNGLPARV